ncbi:MAG: DegV family protein [Lachnospiraceae bacterium]|nr:DegV family protein [Lachnospiraceae bacterium]
MSYKIVSDSAVNLRKQKGQIAYASVPLKIMAGDKEFTDDDSLDVQGMVNYMSGYKGKSGTACPGTMDWIQAFGEADTVFCVTITSGLSGSYNSARVAKEEYEEMHPGRRVFIVDSLSAGPEMEMIVDKLDELISQGKDYEEICDGIMAYKEKTGLMFSLESLTNLANNGRVSPVVAKIAGVLGIRIVGRASDKGQLDPMDKCRGEKKALAAICKRMKELGYAGGKVRIDHCNNKVAADNLKELILQEYPGAEVAMGVTYGLCSFYAEQGGLMVGFEKE